LVQFCCRCCCSCWCVGCRICCEGLLAGLSSRYAAARRSHWLWLRRFFFGLLCHVLELGMLSSALVTAMVVDTNVEMAMAAGRTDGSCTEV
jgi:hypothetical protein